MTKRADRYWARHYQDEWSARSGDPRLPYWLRVVSLAYGHHDISGHARFKQGEIGLILGTVDKDTGEVRRFANVRREIDRAVEYGWLEEGSYWACLVVPAHAIRMGELGAKRTPCPLSEKHRKRRNRSLTEHFAPPASTPSERFQEETAHSLSAFTPEPFSSLLYHPTAQRKPGTNTPTTDPKEAS